MAVVATYPLITVTALHGSRDFFVQHFGMQVLFEASWVVMLTTDGDAPIVGLMSRDHPSDPPGPEEFDGLGMVLTVQTDDAAALGGRLRADGAPITYDLNDEPWGQRRFMTVDPSGIRIDVVEQTEPAAGFWEQYL